jgi:excinuclease ABC subunit C
MKEVVTRRYKRLIEEEKPLPDLIITDGGKGQMGIVHEALNELNITIPVAGLAKDDKHHTSELLYGKPPQVIGIKQSSPLFMLLTKIQSEVHRYAIAFHKEKRSKRQITSELDTIKGIGNKTKELLLKNFKSVKRIKSASVEEIEQVVGKSKTATLLESLRQE